MLAERDGNRVLPEKGMTAQCPMCRSEVIAKCGDVVRWHWSHTVARDCPVQFDGVTEWHLEWQSYADQTEVTIGAHRADIVTPDGMVVEVQHSAISVEDIRAREVHYGRMMWVFDARTPFADDRFVIRKVLPEYQTFRWKHPRKSVRACRKPVFLDLGDDTLFQIKKISTSPKGVTGGWGYRVPVEDVRALIVGRKAAQAYPGHM